MSRAGSHKAYHARDAEDHIVRRMDARSALYKRATKQQKRALDIIFRKAPPTKTYDENWAIATVIGMTQENLIGAFAEGMMDLCIKDIEPLRKLAGFVKLKDLLPYLLPKIQPRETKSEGADPLPWID
jgi:hypothetical protein